MLLTAKTLVELLILDMYLLRKDFAGLYRRVQNWPLRKTRSTPDAILRACTCVDTTCVWYPKRVLCLQKSAATTCILRYLGVPAQLVIGARKLPFKAHAWVEVNGAVVNDRPYVPEIYSVIDRL